jgi:predicted AAA+ superfamily ATPase
MKQNMAEAKQKNFFYFRENNGLEIDLLIDDPVSPLALEIKSTMTPSLADVNNLLKFIDLSANQFKAYLVCPSLEKQSFKGVKVINHLGMWFD